VSTFSELAQRYNFDGVDLNINSYEFSPNKASNMIIALKKAIGSKLLMVTTKD
jgi:hypothetical protein